MTRDSFAWLSIWSSSQCTGVVAAHIQSGAVSTVNFQWIRVSVSYEKWEDVCQAHRGHTAPMFLGVRFIDWSPALCPFHPLTHSIPYQDTCRGDDHGFPNDHDSASRRCLGLTCPLIICGDVLPSFLLTNPPNTTPPFASQIVASVSARGRLFYTHSTTGMSALDDSVWVNGTVCNAQQFNQSLSSSDNPNPTISCLTHGQSIGLAVGNQLLSFYCLNLSRAQLTAEASFLSFFSVIAIGIYIRVSPTLGPSPYASVRF